MKFHQQARARAIHVKLHIVSMLVIENRNMDIVPLLILLLSCWGIVGKRPAQKCNGRLARLVPLKYFIQLN